MDCNSIINTRLPQYFGFVKVRISSEDALFVCTVIIIKLDDEGGGILQKIGYPYKMHCLYSFKL